MKHVFGPGQTGYSIFHFQRVFGVSNESSSVPFPLFLLGCVQKEAGFGACILLVIHEFSYLYPLGLCSDHAVVQSEEKTQFL